MTWPPPGPVPPRRAVLSGWQAWAVDRILRRSVTEDALLLDRLPPRERALLAGALRDVNAAAVDWVDQADAAAGGNAAAPVAEIPSGSAQDDDEINTDQAAQLLDLKPRRVRDLAAAGCFQARRVGGAWLCSRASVLDFAAERRRDAG